MSVGGAVVFLGPTLPIAEAGGVLDAEYLPPVQLGDVWRISRERPKAIGIVDGYFHQVPAVWHKEILYALSLGIAVYGSASMGALRAAELTPFGMIGVGEIAEGYRSGALTRDDEVALMHAPGDYGYQGFSEPLVNIRATLKSARLVGVISTETADLVLATAQSIYYGDRTWPRILGASDGPAAQLTALEGWLPSGRVDQKRADALAMLERMRLDLGAANGPPQSPANTFAPTVLWQELVRRETPLREVLEEFLLAEPLSAGIADAIRDTQAGGSADWWSVLTAEPEWPSRCRRARLKSSLSTEAETGPAAETKDLLAWFFAVRLGWPNDLASFLLARGWTDYDVVAPIAAREASYLSARTGDPLDHLAPTDRRTPSPGH